MPRPTTHSLQGGSSVWPSALQQIMTPILPRPQGGSKGDGVVPSLSYSQGPFPSTTPPQRPSTTKTYVTKTSPHHDLSGLVKATYTLTASDHDYSDTDSGLGGGVTPSPNTTLTPSIMSSMTR